MAARNTLALCLLVGLAQARKPDVVVELGANAHVPLATQFAAQSCVGLMNRDATTTVFALMIVTAAGVRDLLLLEDGLVDHDLPVVFDATKELAGASERDATRYVFDRYANETTTMAKMDPGYEGKPPHAALTGSANPALVDFIVKEKLFNFFLYDGCVPLTKTTRSWKRSSRTTLARAHRRLRLRRLLALAGDLFEAETTCAGHAMGQVASNGFSNLGFFSADAPTETPKVQPFDHAATPAAYDGGTTYVSFVVGDGDNLEMVKGSRRQWMAQRRQLDVGVAAAVPDHLTLSARCSSRRSGTGSSSRPPRRAPTPSSCRPRAICTPIRARWTRSSSGVRERHARDAYLLNSSATVAWEFLGSWTKAIADFFPKYAATRVAGLFAVNVPYLFPIVDFGFAEQYKVLSDDAGNRAVLFRPNEWRGTTCPHGDDRFGASVANVGDVDGDGVEDLAVGAPGDAHGSVEQTNNAGAVYFVLRDGAGGAKRVSKAVVDKGQKNDWFGSSVAAVGDVDGDGRSEVVVGAPFWDAPGRTYGARNRGSVHSGPATTSAFRRRRRRRRRRRAPTPRSGAHKYDDPETGLENVGCVYICYMDAKRRRARLRPAGGRAPRERARRPYPSLRTNDYFGVSLASLGRDGDGHLELLVGASGVDDGGARAGAAFLLTVDTDGEFIYRRDYTKATGGSRAQKKWDQKGVKKPSLCWTTVEPSMYSCAA
ncbi:hypothetical protein JL722_13509 [Aureococcus anophagefferens]|nr:hypothetical protein JL722_13509 [Aureococcus anophagefferens]